MSEKRIGDRRARKLRELNADITLLDYVEKINAGDIKDFETSEIDLNQYVVVNANLKPEVEHCEFKILQLVKNGRKTWYGK